MADEPLLPESVMRQIVKVAYTVPISTELLRDQLRREITPEERGEYDRRKAIHDGYLTTLTEAMASAPEPLTALAELHKPDPQRPWPICRGCDIDGYEAEYPEWPCRTAELIGTLLGVPNPPS